MPKRDFNKVAKQLVIQMGKRGKTNGETRK